MSPAVLALASENAPNRTIVCAGAGGFELAHITLTKGIYVAGDPPSAEEIVAHWAEVGERKGEIVPEYGFAQSELELKKAGYVVPQKEGV